MRRAHFLAACAAAVALSLPVAAWAQATASRAAASSPAFGSLPVQREAATGSVDWLPQFIAATLVLAAFAWFWQWRKGRLLPLRSGAAPLRSVTALRLTPAATLHVVHWGGEELLLACGNASVTVVARRPTAAAPQPAEVQP